MIGHVTRQVDALLGMVEVMALGRGQKGKVVATVVISGGDDYNCEP